MRTLQSKESSVRTPQSKERSVGTPQSKESSIKTICVIPWSGKVTSIITLQNKRKTQSLSIASSPIPQLDGVNSSKPKPEPDLELDSEPEPVQPSPHQHHHQILNILFSDICNLRTTEKIGNYYACFSAPNSLVSQCCKVLHWQSKPEFCLTYDDVQFINDDFMYY